MGRGGDSVGEAGWSARLPWRRKEGGGEAGMVARSCLSGGRRRPTGPSRPKCFLGQTVLLGRADRVGQNQIKSILNFYLNSGIWQDFKNLYKEI
jgi:hypothetical protein